MLMSDRQDFMYPFTVKLNPENKLYAGIKQDGPLNDIMIYAK